MTNIKKSTWVIGAVVLLGVFLIARQAVKILQGPKEESLVSTVTSVNTGSRELSVVSTFDVPNDKQETVRFTVVIDKNGVIESARESDAKTGEMDEHSQEFSTSLTQVLKGKKLSELTAIDKVGTSSLTTWAFNDAIDELRRQL
jgi:hypothetical protein